MAGARLEDNSERVEQAVGPTVTSDTSAQNTFTPPVGDGVCDDTVAIQTLLDAGQTVYLDPGKNYRITETLRITVDGSGIVGDGTSTLTMDLKPGAFDNTSAAAADRYNTNSVGIYALDVNSPVLSGVTITTEGAVDGRYVRPMAFRNCSDVVVTDNDISGFTDAGNLIHLDDCTGALVSGNHLHDCTTNGNILAQITGIGTDADSGQFGSNGTGSSHVVITGNLIEHLTVGPDFYAAFGYQTDGINIGFQTADFTISGNIIRDVGEGIDMFGLHGLVTGNLVDDAKLFALKFIHGASEITAEYNILRNTGYLGIVVSGSQNRDRDTADNVISYNFIDGIYMRDPDLSRTGGIGIRSAHSLEFLPRDNVFLDNIIHLAGNAKYGLAADDGTGNQFIGNQVDGFTVSASNVSPLSGTVTSDAFTQGSWLSGTSQSDFLFGTRRSDILEGSDGNDRLNGRAASDIMIGGSGSDCYIVDCAGDAILEAPDEGADIVVSSTISLDLGSYANVERAILGGSLDLNIAGNGTGNKLLGNLGANWVSGMAGDDAIRGRWGADHLEGGAGDDLLDGGTGDDYLLGGDGDDVVFGQTGNDTLDGGAGIDVLKGGLGSDQFVFSPAGVSTKIEDYVATVDTIDLSAFSFATAAEARNFASDVPEGVEFRFNDSCTLLVLHTSLALLTDADILV